jgi:hypothetical protein
MPILAHLENILRKRNICAALYHGSKLNGVDCCELMTVANDVFDMDIKPYKLSIPGENRCLASPKNWITKKQKSI